MLFELLYLTNEPSKPNWKALEKTLEQLDHLSKPKKQEGETVFHYRNPDTRVSCRFVRYEPEEPDEVGLAFETELPRPTFFALEVLPMAILVARELRLAVDVLFQDNSELVEKPTVETLLDFWHQRNREAANQENGLHQARCDNLESLWEFMMLRRDLARRYSRRGVKVPELGLLVEKRTGKVGRFADWKGLGPVALGDIDWVRLRNVPEPLEDNSYYEAETFFQAVKPMVRAVPQPVYHHLCDKDSVVDDLVEAITALKRKSSRSFDEIDFEQVVDFGGS